MISQTFLSPQYKKNPFATKLNLVALMDIFTILVFFLLLNSGESENVEYERFVQLPSSTTGTAPHKQLTILIGETEIWLEDSPIIKVEEALKKPGELIEPLAAALSEHTQKRGELSGFEKANGLSVVIMGDKNVRYALLKSVMATCRQQDYRNISLAVNQGVVVNSPGLDTTGAGG
ncbi:MAG: biopolymer transporter ExbD [Pseudomonadota bacterium]